MRWSRAHIPTLRDAPQVAEVQSHKLMLRAGMMRQVASGIYSYLPVGWKVIHKVENIIRDEMNRSGAQEVLMPFVQPKELWDEAGRWSLYGKELARFQDRHENDFCLQPTSEEVITDLLRRDLKSYRQLPMNLYQIQTKFRDEIRPRFGVMRGREFIMKDAYSFDLDKEAAYKSYEEMRKAYRRIFIRSGLEFKPVEADTGAIGGKKSEEFAVLAESGEDELISCVKCDYGANQEKAEAKVNPPKGDVTEKIEEFPTPGLRTIEDLAKSTGVSADKLMKTMIAKDGDGKIIIVLLRGDHEIDSSKLQILLAEKKDMRHVQIAADEDMKKWNLPKGSLGPAQFPHEATVVMDSALSLEFPYISGANKNDVHFKNLVLGRDAKVDVVGTVRHIGEGEICPKCGGTLKVFRGIEVGHVFYLGDKYSKAMGLQYTAEKGEEKTVEMGCYGIGVTRTVAACIEQNNDKWGIAWPVSLAPYECSISNLGEGRPAEEAERIYKELSSKGIDVIWDDRDLSPGVKLKDTDLVGIPYQVIVGSKGLKENKVEWKMRKSGERDFIPLESIVGVVVDAINSEKKTLMAEANKYL